MKKLLYLVGITLIVSYLCLLIFLFVIQESLIFYPQKISFQYYKEIINNNSNVEAVEVETGDRLTLRGWLVHSSSHRGAEKAPLIIYYGGNAEEISHLISEIDQFNGYSLLLMPYRGYGVNDGKPNESSLFQDAELIYDYILQRPDIDPQRIVVMGRSIGSGVAVYIAKGRKTQGVILVTPYDSLLSVAQGQMRYVPVALILRNRFNSIERTSGITTPMLALIAANDEVISPKHAWRLVKKWGGKVMMRQFEGVGHNTIDEAEGYWESIREFLVSLNHTGEA